MASPKTCAAGLSVIRAVDLVKRLEYGLKFMFRDANSGVAYRKLDNPGVDFADFNIDSAGVAELDCVAEQVQKNLADPEAIAAAPRLAVS